MIIGAFGAPIPYLLGVLWWGALTQSSTVALVAATCLLSLTCALGGAILASARDRVVRNRLGSGRAVLGAALGLVVSAVAIGLFYMCVLIGVFTP